jgi:carbamoyltransferase
MPLQLPYTPVEVKMIVPGIDAFHADSSAALLRDGRLIAAAAEERFRRNLREARVRLSNVDHIALNQDSRSNLKRKIRFFLTECLVLNCLRNRRARAALRVLLEQAFPGQTVRGQLHSVEHHLAHLSEFHVCPFNCVLGVDSAEPAR